MKRYSLPIALLLMTSGALIAQNEQDALRYSFHQINASARSMSMGNAFGALGGDFTSISINPAGLAVYRSSEMSFTPEFNSIATESNFLNSRYDDNKYRMGFGQFGFVVPLKSKSDGSPIKALNISVGYNKIRDFNQKITMQGINNQNSLVDEFVYTANYFNSLDRFTDGLAWETWLIDTLPGGGYYSDFDGSNYGQTQRRIVSTEGKIGEYQFALGANLQDRLYLGAALGIQRISYTENWEHSELDPNDVINYFDAFSYQNKLKTVGSGMNVKVGFILRPIDMIRIGGSIQTPTFLSLSDDFSASMATDLDDGEPTHELEELGGFKYELTSPMRATGSVALILKNLGLISLDYEFVDYSSARLSASDYDFFDENQAVDTRYRAVGNIRLGGEYHLGSLYFRGGLAFNQSPYESGEPNANYDYFIWSAGFGYRDKNLFLDFGLAQTSWEQEYFLYGNTSAMLNSTHTRFATTLGFRF